MKASEWHSHNLTLPNMPLEQIQENSCVAIIRAQITQWQEYLTGGDSLRRADHCWVFNWAAFLINVSYTRVLFMSSEACGRTSSHTPRSFFSPVFSSLLLIRVGAGRRSRAGQRNVAASQESWSGYFEVEDEDLMFLDYLGVLLCYVFLVVNSDIEKTEQAISNFPSEWGWSDCSGQLPTIIMPSIFSWLQFVKGDSL